VGSGAGAGPRHPTRSSRGPSGQGSSRRSNSLTPLQRLVRLPLRALPPTTTVRILSGQARGRRWIVGSSVHANWVGSYDRRKTLLFASALEPHDVVYDIGAHVGLYSLIAAPLVGDTGHVYAFEPLPRNLVYLRRHLELNCVTNCTVLDVAVSTGPGCAAFDKDVHPAMGHLVTPADGTLTVRTAGLDELVARGVLRPPAVLKCDVEGAEHDVLCGAESILATHRPLVFLATHGADVHARCCDLLRAAGYDLFAIDGRDVTHTDELLALPR
jgi:FkbM family methyltransferase